MKLVFSIIFAASLALAQTEAPKYTCDSGWTLKGDRCVQTSQYSMDFTPCWDDLMGTITCEKPAFKEALILPAEEPGYQAYKLTNGMWGPEPESVAEWFPMSNTASLYQVSAFEKPTEFGIRNADGKKVLSIAMADGSVTYGEGVTPTEAAKQFAQALKELWPSMFACPEAAVPVGASVLGPGQMVGPREIEK